MIIYNDNSKAYDELSRYLKAEDISSVFILCDTNTKHYCLDYFMSKVSFFDDISPHIIEIRAGEENKNLQTCTMIWENLLQSGGDRKSLLINLGGGVLSDIGGYIASTFKRGVQFINIPTTLLSMVDAGIGGKNGIDFNGLKNVIGTFNSAGLTLIDKYYLETLPPDELINGYAEMIKHALIADRKHWAYILENGKDKLAYDMIKRSVDIKLDIVTKDKNEKNIRKTLNFGHTIGHAVETYYLNTPQFKTLGHGKAVAAGMIVESYLSFTLGYLDKDTYKLIEKRLLSMFGKTEIPLSSIDKISDLTKNDKKNKNGKRYFVLLKNIGEAIFDIEVKENQITDALYHYTNLSNTWNEE